jgi:hypothetical protein
MVMMTYVSQAGTGFREIPDWGDAAYSLMPEFSNDQCHRIGNTIAWSGANQILFITGEMNDY